MEFKVQSDFHRSWISHIIGYGGMSYYLWKDGTLHINMRNDDYFNNEQEAQQFLDNWLPQEKWLTEEQIKREAKFSEEAALNCSIEHYKQILLAGYDDFIEAENKELVSIVHDYCAMCQRLNHNCEKCLLFAGTRPCFPEWYSLYNVTYKKRLREKFDKAVIVVLNKLIEIKNKHFGRKTMDKMIDVRGKKVSESTVVEALKKHCNFEVEKKEHIFKAGEVVDYCGATRLVVNIDGKLFTVNKEGCLIGREQGNNFEAAHYKYLGKLNGFNYSGMDVVD